MSFRECYDKYYGFFEDRIGAYIPKKANDERDVIIDAMTYSLLNGGKRIRAVLVLSICDILGGDMDMAMPYAAAIEMVHAYSLIHDDLPCMDDSDLRRGKPSCHIKYGETIAVLAGDGLQTLGFETAAKVYDGIDTEISREICFELAKAIGCNGMLGGQVIDVKTEGMNLSTQDLDKLNSLKTGALIILAAKTGCIVSGADEDTKESAVNYATYMGLVFQIVDDVLDMVSDPEVLGKPISGDDRRDKSTYASVLGVDRAMKSAIALADKAKSCLSGTKLDCAFLHEMSDYFVNREK